MYFLVKIVASCDNIEYIYYYINQLVMISLIFYYAAWYLSIGLVSAFLVDQDIRLTQRCEPYKGSEIYAAAILWPIHVSVFVSSFIYSFFK
jgi:hypothetical protein